MKHLLALSCAGGGFTANAALHGCSLPLLGVSGQQEQPPELQGALCPHPDPSAWHFSTFWETRQKMLQWNINYFNISLVWKVPLPSCHLSPRQNCFISLLSPEAELHTAHVIFLFMLRNSLWVVLEHVGGSVRRFGGDQRKHPGWQARTNAAAATVPQHEALQGVIFLLHSITNSNMQYAVTHFWPKLTYHG